ncbi:hypothetical protein CIB84_008399 [Bambusicola thoracicus]|uniref:Uncharacterized protein n=1 Tax=Bambusicola thoracicus TaxID=9083 RepID=A0A2P4SUR0_BAMTH|nr:hypothetical protein CIB84_008399 [Bambusicola thoracicus]
MANFVHDVAGHILQQVLVLHAASSAGGGIFNVSLLCFLLAENFVRDEAIGLDISLASDPLIKANYLESHHKVNRFPFKGLVLYKNYSDVLNDSVFSPSLLSESRMLYFWISEHILNSLASAAFLDGRLVLTIRGEKLQALFEFEDTEAQQKAVHLVNVGPVQSVLCHSLDNLRVLRGAGGETRAEGEMVVLFKDFSTLQADIDSLKPAELLASCDLGDETVWEVGMKLGSVVTKARLPLLLV